MMSKQAKNNPETNDRRISVRFVLDFTHGKQKRKCFGGGALFFLRSEGSPADLECEPDPEPPSCLLELLLCFFFFLLLPSSSRTSLCLLVVPDDRPGSLLERWLL